MSLHIVSDEPLWRHSTVMLGGPAQFFATATTLTEVQEALAFSDKKNVPVYIIGGGSNVIFPDQGMRGLVLKVALTEPLVWEGERVAVTAGHSWDSFVVQTLERGLAGLEALSGIPGLVGASPMQNIGAYGQEVSQTITAVSAIDRGTGELVEFTNQECEFDYRTSRFKGRDRDTYLITEVSFTLSTTASPHVGYAQLQQKLEQAYPDFLNSPRHAQLMAIRASVLELRRSKSMVLDKRDPNSVSCGSFFINPVLTSDQLASVQAKCAVSLPSFSTSSGQHKVPAAWFIEQAGFRKGQRYKSVGISANHALALVNYSGSQGRTTDLLKLKDMIIDQVQQKFDVVLAVEPDILSSG